MDSGDCTIPQLIRHNAENWGNSPAMYMKNSVSGRVTDGKNITIP